MKTGILTSIVAFGLVSVTVQSMNAQVDNDHIRNCVLISHEAVMNRDCTVPSKIGRPEHVKMTDRAQTSYFDPVDCRNQIKDDMDMCIGLPPIVKKPEVTKSGSSVLRTTKPAAKSIQRVGHSTHR